MAGNDRIIRLPDKVLPKQPIRAEDHNKLIDALGVLAGELRARTLQSSPTVKVKRGPGGTTAWARPGRSGGKAADWHPFKISYDSGNREIVVQRGGVVIETVCPDGTLSRPLEPEWFQGASTENGPGRFDASEFDPEVTYEVICFTTTSGARVEIQPQGGDYELPECERGLVLGDIIFREPSDGEGDGGLVVERIAQFWHSDIQVIFEQLASEGCCDKESSGDESDSEDTSSIPESGSDDDSSDDDSSDDSSDSNDSSAGAGGCLCPDVNITVHLIGIGNDVYNDGTRDMCFPDSLIHPCEFAIEVNVGGIACDEGDFGEIPLMANMTIQFAGAHITRPVSRRFPTSFIWQVVVNGSACSVQMLQANIYFPRGSVPFGTAEWQNMNCQIDQEVRFPGYEADTGICSCSSGLGGGGGD